MTKSNHTSFKAGIGKAQDIILTYTLGKFDEFGKFLLTDAEMQAEFQSFTGNTLTSIAFGLYENGGLIAYSVLSDRLNSPIHAKIRKGETIFLSAPYEGESRSVTGAVGTSDPYGYQTSERILMSLVPKGGTGVVVTTGTEYSEFIEEKGLNVLTETFNTARFQSLSWLKVNPNTPIQK